MARSRVRVRNGQPHSLFLNRQKKVERILQLLNDLPTDWQAEVANRILVDTAIGYKLVHDEAWRRSLVALPHSVWSRTLKIMGPSTPR